MAPVFMIHIYKTAKERHTNVQAILKIASIYKMDGFYYN